MIFFLNRFFNIDVFDLVVFGFKLRLVFKVFFGEGKL